MVFVRLHRDVYNNKIEHYIYVFKKCYKVVFGIITFQRDIIIASIICSYPRFKGIVERYFLPWFLFIKQHRKCPRFLPKSFFKELVSNLQRYSTLKLCRKPPEKLLKASHGLWRKGVWIIMLLHQIYISNKALAPLPHTLLQSVPKLPLFQAVSCMPEKQLICTPGENRSLSSYPGHAHITLTVLTAQSHPFPPDISVHC